jgi:hypothetical protein
LFGWLRLACVAATEVARAATADIAKAPHGSATTVHRPATRRWLRLRDRRAHAMHGHVATRRTTASGAVSATAMTRVTRSITWMRKLAATMQSPAPLRPGTPGERAAARLTALHPIQPANDFAAPHTSATMRLRATPHATATHVASASPAMPRSYASAPAAALSYRRTPRAAVRGGGGASFVAGLATPRCLAHAADPSARAV